MRIHLKIQGDNRKIPYDHQHILVGTIYKWIGRKNNEHGGISLYSFSRLKGGKANSDGLCFEDCGSFFFSAYNSDLIKKMVTGIQTDPTMFLGMSVLEIIIQDDPDLSRQEVFHPGSPIFIKRREGSNIDHILFTDPRSSKCLVGTLQSKMKIAGLSDETFDIEFMLDYPKATSKKINYNGIDNRASWCPVIIKGRPETKLFAWNVGLGNSTGIGFGAIE